MYLRIFDANEVIDLEFGKYLCDIVRKKFISMIDDYNMKSWQVHINTSDEFNKIYSKDVDLDSIFIFASTQLKYGFMGSDLIIEFDPNVLIPGFDRLKLVSLLKMINFGTLSIKGCPIVTDLFNYFEEHIDEYVKVYYNL